jgi:hypothetical protein
MSRGVISFGPPPPGADPNDGGSGADEPIRVMDAHLAAALDQLLDTRSALTQTLLGGGPAPTHVTPARPARHPR